jgi:hypothetical protein
LARTRNPRWGEAYFFEPVPSAEYVGCEYRVERGADGFRS